MKTNFLILLLITLGLTFSTTQTSAKHIKYYINDSTYQKVAVDKNGLEETAQADLLSEMNPENVSGTFFWSLLINVVTLVLIIALVYYPNNRQMENIFSFFMFNLMIFLLTFLLNKIKISMGAAFGLFAVFSMLRYRTEGINMKDMTYLFIFISVGLISAVHLRYYELAIIDAIIILFIYILDGNKFFRRELSKLVEYENIELIKTENYNILLEDLRKRTGLTIHRINIEQINFLKDAAMIKIFYYDTVERKAKRIKTKVN
ncbi:MAG: DUF4956 domain-containing protein [Bacteroidota bacterium]